VVHELMYLLGTGRTSEEEPSDRKVKLLDLQMLDGSQVSYPDYMTN
jgi:hypothetical protein